MPIIMVERLSDCRSSSPQVKLGYLWDMGLFKLDDMLFLRSTPPLKYTLIIYIWYLDDK